MTCVHLRQLYKLCDEHDLKISGSDLIKIVCHECGEQEVCPSAILDRYDETEPAPDEAPKTDRASGDAAAS